MIKYVFLDIDDTLLDFGKAEAAAIKKTFDRIGVPSSPEVIALYSRINDEHWAMLERGELTREQVLVKRFDALFAELGIKNVPSEMAQASYEYLLGIGHYFVDGAPELLQALKDKYELYIVSNGTASVQDSRLESAGIAPYFKDIFISERLGADKPTKKLTMRLIRTMSDPPTAASAVFPTNCPSCTASNAEFSCCSSVPMMIFRKKAIMPC